MKNSKPQHWLKAAAIAAVVMGGGQTALAWSPPPWEFERQGDAGAEEAPKQSSAGDAETPGKYRLLRAEESFLDESRYIYADGKGAKEAYDSLGVHGYLSDDEEIMRWRAWYASEAGMIAEAEGLYRELIVRDPENPWNYNALGYLLASEFGRLQDAIELLEKAWKIERNEPAIVHSLGYVFQRGGQLSHAITHYDRSLGSLLERRKQYEEDLYLHFGIALRLADREVEFERLVEITRTARGGEDALYLYSIDAFNTEVSKARRDYQDLSKEDKDSTLDFVVRINP